MLKKFINYSLALIVLVGVGVLVFGYDSSAAIDDFSVSLQLVDDGCVGQFGQIQTTAPFSNSALELATPWAYDANGYDPDCARLQVNTSSQGLPQNDFQVCLQAVDGVSLDSSGNIAGYSQEGDIQCTPMASAGGGWSGWAADSNYYDFDALRLIIRKSDVPLPDNQRLKDLRIGLQLSDSQCTSQWGVPKYTPWYTILVDAEARLAAEDTSFVYDPWSNFAFDSNAYDPDCTKVGLDVQLEAGPDEDTITEDDGTEGGDNEDVVDEGATDEVADGNDQDALPTFSCSLNADPEKLSKDSEGDVIGRSLLYWRCSDDETGELAPGKVRLSSNTEVFGIDKEFAAQSNVYVTPTAPSTLFSLFYDGQVKATVLIDVVPASFDEVNP